jgi:hypothetical protein
MSHIKSLRYGAVSGIKMQSDREVSVNLHRGYNVGMPDYRLPDGYTGNVLNMIPSAYGFGITPRSGFTVLRPLYNGLQHTTAINQVHDTKLNPMVLGVASNTTQHEIHKLEHVNGTWSQLSRLGGIMSHTTKDHVEIIQASSSAINRAIIVNGTNTPKYVDVTHNVGVWSDFTFPYSIASVAATGTLSDERLVLANLNTPNSTTPKRLMWSVRGTPSNFQIASGAGFADLNEMETGIMRLVADTQGFVILADGEIWRARPRRDIYAFDFIPITRDLGCPFPNTAVRSPFGTIFLGQDFEVYTLTGSNLKPLGPASDTNGVSRIRRKLREYIEDDPTFAWGVYDFVEQRYYIHVTPNHAYMYDFRTDSWWPELYDVTLAWRGTMVTDIPAVDDSSRIWDLTTDTWDNTDIPWNDAGTVRPPLEQSYVLTTAAVGVPYLRKSHITGDGWYPSAFTTHWETPRLSANGRRYNYNGSWVEFSTQTTSNITVTTKFDNYTLSQVRSLQSSELSTAWAPTHGITRGARVKVEFDCADKVNFTGFTGLIRVAGAIGGGR